MLLRECDFQEQNSSDIALFVCDSYVCFVCSEDYLLAQVLVRDLVARIGSSRTGFKTFMEADKLECLVRKAVSSTFQETHQITTEILQCYMQEYVEH